METTALTIVLPDVSSSVTIAAEWFEKRNKMVARAQGIAAVTDSAACDDAGEVIRLLAKAASELESQRKKITDPFLRAQKVIKAKADEAAAPLLSETDRLKMLVAKYATEERARIEAEQRAAEERRRAEVERQIAESAKLAEEKAKELELFGGEEAEVAARAAAEAVAAQVVVPDAPARVEAPKVSGVRITQSLAFTVVNADEVPRRFLMVDNVAIRKYLAEEKERITERMKEDGEYQPIAGVVVRMETGVASR